MGIFTHDLGLTVKLGIELGTVYERLRSLLDKIRKHTESEIIGFSDMTVEQISKETGLSVTEAELAKKREYDEVFKIIGDEQNVLEAIKKEGLNHTKGGRYFHLTGDNDKGKAVRKLIEVYKKKFSDVKSVGLGDSLNDLPMMKAVDIAFLVQKPDKSYDKTVSSLPDINKVRGVGPAGWNKVVLGLLEMEHSRS